MLMGILYYIQIYQHFMSFDTNILALDTVAECYKEMFSQYIQPTNFDMAIRNTPIDRMNT